MTMMKKLKFLPQNVDCSFEGKPSILEVALAHEIPLNHSCGGMGSCTTCLVSVVSGVEKLASPNELEAEHAQARGFMKNERLACQTDAVDGLILEIPKDNELSKSEN